MLLYPINYKLSFYDKLIYKSKWIFFYCNICAKFTYFKINKKIITKPEIELRESLICNHCGSTNRNRQMAYIITKSPNNKIKYPNLVKFTRKNPHLYIYNTENSRALHTILSKSIKVTYISSEFINANIKSGEVIRVY